MQTSPLSNVTGFILIALGLLSVIYPAYSSVTLEAFFGSIFLVGGIFHAFGAYEARERADYLYSLCIGILYLLMGIVMLGNPTMGLFAITYLLIILFLAQGGLQFVAGLRQRTASPKWYWSVIAGFTNIVFGTILFVYFPISAVFALGVLVGLNLLTLGCSMLFVNRIIGKE
ncbi:Putative acid-resistance membrane protein [Candidatus Bealeia paramacronuclearis]|uniref:Acid-resistance membrane protein n=1 Tax=Candidatus Bealeia paramacronuclearis TaxID=1921001 RepID=A0ABZ2C5T6_9PROT|nr:putative acid-resistance membrane protein [Candidatus Bealeia paramacronuclearis]